MKKLITLILVAVLMIGFAVVANAAVGTVVKANKTDKAPNLEYIDESWGEPVIRVTPDSPNAELFKYWNEFNDTAMYSHEGTGPNGRTTIEPEDSSFDLFIRWDNKYLYIGVLSADYEICGSVEAWRGDGVQMWIQPLETLVANNMTTCGFYNYTDALTNPTSLEYKNQYQAVCQYYWTLDFDDYSVSNAGAAAECEKYILMEDDMMHCTIAIPLSNFGLNAKKMDLHGFELGAAILRMSSKSSFDEGYAGCLVWGKFFEHIDSETINTIVLVDPAQGDVTPSTEAPATEAPATEAPATEAPATEAPATEAPATEAPATEAPATEAPATEAPATEAPATEAPATEAPATEAPATEAPATEAPATEAPATEAPATEAPATEAPATEAPATEAPATEAPATEAPATEAPATEAPATEAPVTEAPATEAPATEAPATEAPATEAPATEAPATEAPATEAPATEAPATEPKTEEPVEKSNTGLIIAIVAVVVVVGAGLGIVLGKKKK